jgi:hypothetical protein
MMAAVAAEASVESTRGAASPTVPANGLAAVALRLARTAGRWRDRIEAHATERTGLRVLGCDAYDAWLLRWPSGARVSPHDHGESAAAFTVVAGELTEIRWHGLSRDLRTLAAGQVVTVDVGVVHDVIATGAAVALSLHLYSPPLTTMGFYDDVSGGLQSRLAVDASEQAFAAGWTSRRVCPAAALPPCG